MARGNKGGGGNRLYAQVRKLDARVKELEEERDQLVQAGSAMVAERDVAIQGQLTLRAEIAECNDVMASLHIACQYAEYAKDKIVRRYLAQSVAKVQGDFAASVADVVAPAPPPTPTQVVGAPDEPGGDPDAVWNADMAEAKAEDDFEWDVDLDGDDDG